MTNLMKILKTHTPGVEKHILFSSEDKKAAIVILGPFRYDYYRADLVYEDKDGQINFIILDIADDFLDLHKELSRATTMLEKNGFIFKLPDIIISRLQEKYYEWLDRS